MPQPKQQNSDVGAEKQKPKSAEPVQTPDSGPADEALTALSSELLAAHQEATDAVARAIAGMAETLSAAAPDDAPKVATEAAETLATEANAIIEDAMKVAKAAVTMTGKASAEQFGE